MEEITKSEAVGNPGFQVRLHCYLNYTTLSEPVTCKTGMITTKGLLQEICKFNVSKTDSHHHTSPFQLLLWSIQSTYYCVRAS